jgi:MFS family permease
MVFYFGSLMIGPIIAGAMTEHANWQSFWWFNVALFGTLILMILFGFPETKFLRNTDGDSSDNSTTNGITEKPTENSSTTDESKLDTTLQPQNTEAQIMELDPWLHKGYPGKHQWPTFYYPRLTKGHLAAALIRDFWIPWKLFIYPIVQFASFVFSWSASNFLVVNLTQSQVFAAPPYNFSPQNVGFTNFAVFAGALFALATAGPFSDWVAMRQTIRNNGIREPEMRLLALIPYTVLLFLGSLIVALGYEYQWPWEVIVIVGYFPLSPKTNVRYTFIGVQVTAIPAMAMTYTIDSYRPIAGEFLVSATINKNVWGYGVSKFITEWILADGFIAPIMTNNGLTLLWVIGGGVGLFFFGKTVRRWTKDSSVHKLEAQSA